MFNAVKPLSIVSDGTAKSKQMQENYLFQIIWEELYKHYHYRADLSFKLQIIKVFEVTR
jgi:hypothetical protein